MAAASSVVSWRSRSRAVTSSGTTMPRGYATIAAHMDEPTDGPDLEALERAAAAEPDEPAHHASLGSALHAPGRHDDAIAAHRRAIAALRVQLGSLHYNLGASLAAAGRLDDAAAAYRDALRERPGWELAHHNLGALCCAAGDYAGA